MREPGNKFAVKFQKR